MSKKKPNILAQTLEIDHNEPAMQVNTEEFRKVVESRRSVRQFEKESIPDSVIQDCLRLAMLAPSSSNLQPWEFYWIKDPSIREKMNTLCMNQNAARTAATLIVCVARSGTWKQNSREMLKILKQEEKTPKIAITYYQKLIPLAHGFTFPVASWFKKLAISISGMIKPTPRIPCNKMEQLIWAHKSTALACENLMLALRAYGFDSCPMEGMDKVRIAKLLQIPRDGDVSMVIGAGKRAKGGIYGPQIRFAPEKFIKSI